mmetsp:Transcript_96406/g.311301  ORF Transcript_96406/g.311301 Transcript_96406/m.311301 type:complete len:287 (+) Transcript_96406:290-1150(+)
MDGKRWSGFTSSFGEMPPRSLAPSCRHLSRSSQPGQRAPVALSPPWSTRFGGTWMATSGGSAALAARTRPGNAAAASAPKSGSGISGSPAAAAEPAGRSRCVEPKEWGCRITSWMWPKSSAALAMTSSACRRSEGVSPTPTSKPVVKGTRNSPACRSCATRTSGRLLGAKRCTPPGPSSDGAVCSSMRPMEAFTAARRCISARESGPTLVCGRKPSPRATEQMASARSAQAPRLAARGCTSPAMTRTSTTSEAPPPAGSRASRRPAASAGGSQSLPSRVTSLRKLQ